MDIGGGLLQGGTRKGHAGVVRKCDYVVKIVCTIVLWGDIIGSI